MASSKDALVSTLYNSLAVTRVGRLDDIRKEAERLVDEALEEHTKGLADKIYEGIGTLPEGSDWFAGMFDARDIVRAEAQKC
jgi:hypothetical protein